MTAILRRRLLSAPAALLAPLALTPPAPPPRPRAMLRPGRPGEWQIAADAPGQTLFRAEGMDGAIALPCPGARMAGLLPIAGRQVACLAFAVPSLRGELSAIALAGWDGDGLRLLGLELADWRGAQGGRLWSRYGGVADRTRLRIGREAAVVRPDKPRAWENWTDYLAWREGAALAQALVRPPPAGSWQARLAALRGLGDRLLATPRQSVPVEWLTAVQAMFGGYG
jgi:hypothetical protein